MNINGAVCPCKAFNAIRYSGTDSQLHMQIPENGVDSPLGRSIVTGVSGDCLLESQLPLDVGVDVDPVVGNPFGPPDDNAAAVQGVFVLLSHPACRSPERTMRNTFTRLLTLI